MIARHCAGGLILGFEQFQATAGILFRLGLPLLIFRERSIGGGVIDVVILTMPGPELATSERARPKEVFLKWYDKSAAHCYQH